MPPRSRQEYRDDASVAGRLDLLMQHNFGGFSGFSRLLLTNVDYLLGTAVKFTQPKFEGVNRLVFVCLANLQRSAFAQAVAQQAGLRAASFGLCAADGIGVPLTAARIADELGCPIRKHEPVDLTAFEPLPGDLYLTMEQRHAYQLLRYGFAPQRVALLGHWSRPRRLHLHDPLGLHEDYTRSCFTLIGSAVFNLARELREQGQHLDAEPDAPAFRAQA